MDEECVVAILVENNQRWIDGLELVVSKALAAIVGREQVPVHDVCEDIMTVALRVVVKLGHHPICSVFKLQFL